MAADIINLLATAWDEVAKEKSLVSFPEFNKCSQLYATLRPSRAMLVGVTLLGKTTYLEVLMGALNRIAEPSTQQKPIKKYVINPKALTLDQLYGSFDAASHEWTDSALSNIPPEASGWSPLRRAWAGSNAVQSLLALFNWLIPLTLMYLCIYCRMLLALPSLLS